VSRNGFVSGVMRVAPRYRGDRPKGRRYHAPAKSEQIGRQAPVKRCLARKSLPKRWNV